MTVTQPIFTKVILFSKFFKNNSCTEFHKKNPTTDLVAENGSQTDGPNALYFYFVKYG
jgi:hypothetical protein